MREKILKELACIEHDFNVTILFAAEAGSRAWGFESTDSDYDVRFIYVRNRAHYLNIFDDRHPQIDFPILEAHRQNNPDSTEYRDPLLDYSGWDLRKALGLAYRSNPQLNEWLASPTVYVYREQALLDQVCSASYRRQQTYMHYFDTAKNNFRTYLQTKMVRYKKYLYVIRPLLAARYVLERDKFPPVPFELLLPLLNAEPEVRAAVDRLIDVKRTVTEDALMPRDEVLNAWIIKEMANKQQIETVLGTTDGVLNAAFRLLVNKYDRL